MSARSRRGRLRAVLGVLAVCLGLCAAPAPAADGELDPTFDGDGRVVSDPTGFWEGATDVAIDAEGRIVVSATARNPMNVSDTRAVVARYNADGSPDPTFGDQGALFVEWTGGSPEIAGGVSIDGAGRIVVGGAALMGPSGFDFAVARFLPTGIHDSSFDEDGTATLQIPEGGMDVGLDVTVDAQDRPLVVGRVFNAMASQDRFGVARFGVTGQPDDAFSGDGSLATSFPGMDDSEAAAVEVDPSGRPTVAGGASTASNALFAVARYDDAGNLDPSFDGDGRAVLDPGTLQGTIANDLALEPDGRIALGGQSATQLESVIELGRLLPDGAPDAGFGGGDGAVTTDLDERLFGRGLALDPAGRLVLAGEIGEPLLPDALVARYSPEGALDGEFGTAGLVRERFSSEAARAGAVAVDAQGRYVFAGAAIGPGGASSIALMRLLASYPVPAVSRDRRIACRGRAATIVGTPKRNRLRGTKRRDVIAALGGNDVVRGLAGNDLICAGGGRDLIKAGRGRDVVAAGAGRDRVFGQAGRDKLLGQQGRDLLVGGPGRDALRGGPGRDRQRR